MGSEPCVHCGRSTVLPGDVTSGLEGGRGDRFAPAHARYSRNRPGVPLRPGTFRACASCGHVWSSLDPRALRDFVAEYGDELLRQHLDELERGPFRDLPDTELARSIGARVAELDAPAWEGKPGVIGRFREMTGLTWDEAIKLVSRWARLTREEKLALFGWRPKAKKGPIDDLDLPYP